MTISIQGIGRQHCKPGSITFGGNPSNPSSEVFNATKLTQEADKFRVCLEAESTDRILNANPDYNPYANRHGRFEAAALRAYGRGFFYNAVDHEEEDKKARDKTRTLAAAA